MCRHIKPNIEAKYIILHAISYFHVAYNISMYMYMLWVRVPPEAAHFSSER